MPKSVQSSRFSKTGRAKINQFKRKDHPMWLQISEGMLLGYKRTKKYGGRWYYKFNGELVGDGRDYVESILGNTDDTADADGRTVLSFGQAQAKLHQLKKDMCDKVYVKEVDSIT